MQYTVLFKQNSSPECLKPIVNHPFLMLYPKSVAIRQTYTDETRKVLEKIEIFVPERLAYAVPAFFIGELRALSSQILDVQWA